MPIPLVAAVGLLLLTSGPVSAAVTATVVDIPTRPGVTQRILYVRPDAPKANIVYISGGTVAWTSRATGR